MTDTALEGPTALYRFFDNDGHLLYVGITGRGPARWVQHAGVQPWWLEVSDVSVEHHGTRQGALDAEMWAIADEGPLYNLATMVPAQRSSTAKRRIQLLMPPDLLLRLDELCSSTGRSRTEVIEEFCRQGLGIGTQLEHTREKQDEVRESVARAGQRSVTPIPKVGR